VSDELLDLADESPETVLEYFAERGWGDGLPLVPPTPERVNAMLAACSGDADPDEVLSVLEPRFGECTRRMVAVNAVLAGCPPEVMPVLVAAARALGQPELNLRGVNATTHPVAPLLIVHGEIAERAGFNSGLGAFGPGNRANATTGRALRLLLLHVAGARPRRANRRSTPTASPRTSVPRRGRGTRERAASTRRRPSPSTAVRTPTTSTTWSPTAPVRSWRRRRR